MAQTGSLLPRLHGELVPNVNQLYPIVLSTVYGDGDVQASFADAHRLNAFVIATAAVPVYPARARLGLGLLLALWAGALTVAVPWIVLSSFLLTEVVAYPMFCWALLALTYAVERKRWQTGPARARRDRRRRARADAVRRPPGGAARGRGGGDPGHSRAARRASSGGRGVLLVVLFGTLLLVVLAAIAVDKGSKLLGSYSVTGERPDRPRARPAPLRARGRAGAGARDPALRRRRRLADRPPPSLGAPRERAFAVVGCTALVLVVVQVASFNQRFGAGLVKDRYLFYVVPILLLGLAAAVAARSGRAGGRSWCRRRPPRSASSRSL